MALKVDCTEQKKRPVNLKPTHQQLFKLENRKTKDEQNFNRQ